jgi:hypothetical protein
MTAETKSRKKSHNGLLQDCELVPITDPAIQAALDCLRRAERAEADVVPKARKPRVSKRK